MANPPSLLTDRSREAGLEYMRWLAREHKAGRDVNHFPSEAICWASARTGIKYEEGMRAYNRTLTGA